MEIVHFKIKGMTCDKCAQSIEKAVTKHQELLKKKSAIPKQQADLFLIPIPLRLKK